MNTGQITRGSQLGDWIYNLSKSKSVHVVVDIGMWNGLGTSMCVLEGIGDDPDKAYYGIELYDDMFELASSNIRGRGYPSGNITLLHGAIVDEADLSWFDHNLINFDTDEHARLWYNRDIENIKKAVNVLGFLPESIDLLILDGGEYTTYPEYLKLRARTNILVLDDINILKNDRVLHELASSEDFELLIKDVLDRNGWSIFKRKSFDIE